MFKQKKKKKTITDHSDNYFFKSSDLIADCSLLRPPNKRNVFIKFS